jgi:prepilin-type N-terminal cleavage/methylation domain-containing protein
MKGYGSRRPARGFTIIELALVLAITAILGSLAVLTYTRYANKARFTQAKTVLKHLQKTEIIYFTEHEHYTDNVSVLDFDPTRYDYYTISVVLDNTGYDFTGYATGAGVMAGDLWLIHRDDEPTQDNSSTFR